MRKLKNKGKLVLHFIFVVIICLFVVEHGIDLFYNSSLLTYEIGIILLVGLITVYAVSMSIYYAFRRGYKGVIISAIFCIIAMNLFGNLFDSYFVPIHSRELNKNSNVYELSISTSHTSDEDILDLQTIMDSQPTVLMETVANIYYCDVKTADKIYSGSIKRDNVVAFTIGSDVYLVEGQLSQSTLAHELAHTFLNKHKELLESNELTSMFENALATLKLNNLTCGNMLESKSEFFAETSALHFFNREYLLNIAPNMDAYLTSVYGI